MNTPVFRTFFFIQNKCWISLLCLIFSLPSGLLGQFVINGSARDLGGDCYRLTRDRNNQTGNILSTESIDLTKPFFVDAFINFGTKNGSGADGIAFIMTSDNNLSGQQGGGIGYLNIEPSIIVEMDTWSNGIYSDPNQDHIAIVKNGDPEHFGSNSLAAPVTMSNIEDGDEHCFRMSWNPDTKEFVAFLDGTRVRYFGDIVTEIFNGDPNVFWGFTASTGGSNNNQTVCINGSETTVEPMLDTIICQGLDVELNATPNGVTYAWNPDPTLSAIDIQNPIASTLDSIQYEVTVSYQCGGSYNDTVVVIPFVPQIEFEPLRPLCENDPPQLLNVFPEGGFFDGIGIDGDSFDPAISGVGSFELTYEIEERGCLKDSSIIVEVNEVTPIILSPPGEFCENESDFQLAATPLSGFWQGDVTSTGMIQPSVLGAGDFEATYVYINANDCTDSVTVAFKVNPKPVVDISAVTPLCVNSDSITLDAAPLGGTWSGTTMDSLFVPNQFGVGSFQTIYEFSDNKGCKNSDTLDIVINDLPMITFDPIAPFCNNDSISTLGINPMGGVWSGNVDAMGRFDPASMAPGNYTSYYEFTDGNSCTNSDSIVVTINPVPVVEITPVPSVCETEPPISLVGTPVMGDWAGSATPSGQFVPVNAMIGSNEVIYQFTNSFGCIEDDTLEITILENPEIILTSPQTFCESEAIATLSTNLSPGTWIGAVDAMGMITPSTLGDGNFAAEYQYTDAQGCSDTLNFQIEILPIPIIDFSNLGPFCENESTQIISATPSTGTWSGFTNGSGSFEPSALSTGSHDFSYFYTDGNGCKTDTTISVLINAAPLVQIQPIDSLCPDGLPVQLNANLPNGTWSGAANSDGMVDPMALGSGVQEAIYSFTNQVGCTESDTIEFIVRQPDVIVFPSIDPFCLENKMEQLTAMPAMGTWSGVVANDGSFNPTDLGFGNFQANYSYTSPAGCEVNRTLDFQILEPVNIVFGDSVFCQNEMPQQLVANPSGGIWVASLVDSGGVIDPSDFAVGNSTVEYTYIQPQGNCQVTETLNISINEVPDLEILGDTSFCQTLGNQSFTGTPTNGTWTGVADNSGSVNPMDLSLGSHFITYAFTSTENCSNTIDQEIIITAPPTATFTGDEIICEGQGPIDLTLNLTGTAPFDLVISDGQNTLPIRGLNQGASFSVNPSLTTTYTITSVTDSECGNTVSSAATVTVNSTPFATVTPSLEVCNSDETGAPTVLDFSTLITDGDAGGNWVDVDNSGATGSFPRLDFSGILIGTYVFEYTTNSADAPCVDQKYSTEITIKECKCPSVETATPPVLCNTDATLDLSTLEITTESGGWTIQSAPANSTATIFLGEFEGTGSVAGDYLVQFNLSQPAPGACPESSTQTITLTAPPFADILPLVDVCNTTAAGNTTILDFSTLITAGDDTGTWTAIDNSGATGSLPVLDFENIPEGQYRFSYTTSAAVSPCTNQTFEVIINVRDCSCPSVSTGPAGPFCSDDALLDLSTITFTNEPGSWSITNAPTGSRASISSQNFDANDSAPGDYELTFTLSTPPPPSCPSSSTQTITINEATSAIVSNFGEVCNSTILGDPTTFDFSTLILAGNQTGTWEDIDNSGATGNFPVLDFVDIAPGQYLFRYTLIGAAPCTNQVFETTISVFDCACPSVSTAPTGPFCNDDAILDLSSITITSEDGNWFLTDSPTASTASIAGGVFNANGSVGGDYELTFILNGFPPVGCPQSSVQVITVGEVVTAGTPPNPIQLCNDFTTIDLNDQLIGASPGGYWRDLSSTPADGFDEVTGTIDGSVLESGFYEFEYVANTTAPCQKDSVRFTLEVQTPLNPGALIENIFLCEGIDTVISLYDMIEGYDLGGAWTQISGPALTNSSLTNATVVSIDLVPDRYIFEYRVNPTGFCPSGFVTAEITMRPTPVADAGDDFELNCDQRITTIGTPVSGEPNLIYNWTGNVSDSLLPQPTVGEGGTYILTVSNEITGCTSTDEIVVLESAGIPQLEIERADITCFGENDGTIAVSNTTGGRPPYEFSLNGGPFTNIAQFDELLSGNYTIEVRDSEGCLDTEQVTITEPLELSVNLSSTLTSGNNTIEYGDSLTLSANITGLYDMIFWRPEEGLDTCANGCLSQIVRPTISTSYQVTVTNEQGCTAEAIFPIIVINSRKIYIPTAFSPDNDGLNDIFQIFVGKNVVKVNDFAVFDRWGEEVFRDSDFVPDNSTTGWDGRFRGKFMQSGVYVYYAEIEFTDGAKILYEGDLTLLR